MYTARIAGRARLALLLMLLAVPCAFADVVVIVHPDNPARIDQAILKKIFLGRSKAFPGGGKASPVDLESGEIREEFYKAFLRKDQGAIDSYWSRMIFTGNGRPPRAFRSPEDVLHYVASNPQAIGYIDKSQVDASVKVLEFR